MKLFDLWLFYPYYCNLKPKGMKIKLSPLILGLFALPLCAQVVNTGSATITIQSGATLYIQSSLSNTGGGTITNDGTLEVTGNLTNDGSSVIAGNGLVKFTGTTPSAVTTGGDALSNVEFNKTGANVTLADAMTVTGNVTFGSAGTSKVLLGAYNINLAATSTISGANATHYFIATDNGRVVKSMTTPSPFTFPVGDSLIYSPLIYATTGGSGAGSVSVGVVNAVHPNKPALANSYLTRYWKLNSTYPAIITAMFYPGDDVVGTVGQITGASYKSPNWSYTGRSNGMETVIGSTPTGIYDFTGLSGLAYLNEFSLKAYLQGPFTVDTGGPIIGDTMTTALRYKNYIPLTSPYDNTITVTSIPSDVTDWIQVQVVDPSNASNVYAETSAFIKKNGSIISNLGSGPVSLVFSQTSVSIKLKHRNHLSVRTKPITIDPGTPIEFDFTGNGTGGVNPLVYVAPNDSISPSINLGLPQKEVESGKYAMWSGDVNGNGEVKYNGSANDRALILVEIGGVSISAITNGYKSTDVNLNGENKYNGSGNDRALILVNIGGSSPTPTIKEHK